MVPDVTNPRFSYGGGKIVSELLAFNYGRKHFDRVLIFRPHNVYGPNMGEEHVIPQFAVRMRRAFADTTGTVRVSHSGDRPRDARLHVHRRLHRRVGAGHRARRALERLQHRHAGRSDRSRRSPTWSPPASGAKSKSSPASCCRAAPPGGARTSRSCRRLGFTPVTSYRGRNLENRRLVPQPGLRLRAPIAHGQDFRSESRKPPEQAAASSSSGARCAARRTCSSILFLGYLPPVNTMNPIGTPSG